MDALDTMWILGLKQGKDSFFDWTGFPCVTRKPKQHSKVPSIWAMNTAPLDLVSLLSWIQENVCLVCSGSVSHPGTRSEQLSLPPEEELSVALDSQPVCSDAVRGLDLLWF